MTTIDRCRTFEKFMLSLNKLGIFDWSIVATNKFEKYTFRYIV